MRDSETVLLRFGRGSAAATVSIEHLELEMDDGAPDDSPNEPYERDGYDSDGWPLDDGSLFVEVDFGCADDSYEAPVIRGRRLDNFPHGSAFERVAFVGCIDGFKYEGEFKEDKFHGKGVMIFPNGRKYEGEFKESKAHGKGAMIFPDGHKYEGMYEDGKKKKGVLTYPNGAKYDGLLRRITATDYLYLATST
jgi:hypothetical protein